MTSRTTAQHTCALPCTQGPLNVLLERAQQQQGPTALVEDIETIAQAHLSILTGACLGLALRCGWVGVSGCGCVRECVRVGGCDVWEGMVTYDYSGG